MDTLKKIAKAPFANKAISKVSRDEVVNYLSSMSKYSESTIKQNYELLCMGFGEAEYQKIIEENFMTGYKRVIKPKSEYVSHKRKSLTIDEENSKGKFVKKTDVHTHMLRGTFATRCAEAKIAPVVLKQILGHKDISVTMKYYVDVDGSFIESETDNAIQYLVDKNIFGVELPQANVA